MTYEKLKNKHPGESCVIFGTGPSFQTFENWDQVEHLIFIGCNFGFVRHYMEYSVVIDNVSHKSCKNDYDFKRYETLKECDSEYIITQKQTKGFHFEYADHVVEIEIGEGNAINPASNPYHVINQGKVCVCSTSIFGALSLAIWMGMKTIGLVGFDLYGTQFMSNSQHCLNPEHNVNRINKVCETFLKHKPKGLNIYNLSKESKIDAFLKVDLEEFLDATEC